ncbi:MAG: hypothetical protein DRJ45_06545, partial [Thermoprotei archaeon]
MGIVSAAPSIVAWSSSGGNPTYKENPQDLVYKVQQGDTITFTATSNQSCDWVWEVYFGARVIANFTENNTKTSSFTWQVPNETSTWSIDVACMRKPSVVGPPERAIISWTITTATLIEVNEGEDIQSAIDSLPEEGGIVELKEGTWNITSPIRIRNDSITLVGQGMDKTIINQITPQTDAIVIGKFDDPYARAHWLYENNIMLGYLLEWFKNHPEEIIQNVQVKRMTVNVQDAAGDWEQFASIAGIEAINVLISEIKGTGNPQTQSANDDSVGIYFGYSVDITVKDCILYGYGYTARPFVRCFRVNFLYNTLSQTLGWNSLEFNGVWSLRADWKPEDGYTEGDCDPEHPGSIIKGNRIYNGGKVIHVYSSWKVLVTENYITGTRTNLVPIQFVSSLKGLVASYNIIHNCSCAGIKITFATGAFGHAECEIYGNVIYNNKYYADGGQAGHGISIPRSPQPKTTIYANIHSNTIVGNDGDGIYNPYGWPVDAKNNIIVNNKGYGINGENITSTYNNIWNNTLGNYNQASPGEGDISADPLFADPENGDFHLKSQYGRWDPNQKQWVRDSVTSPCIDAGDPADDFSNELDFPNGRINLGAYGNTWEASLGTPLTTGTLKGKVTDKDTGLPIEGALIEANSYQTTTNSSGDYILNLLPGNYTVTASKDGYYSSTATAEILANQTTTLNFQLTKDITPPAIYNITVSSITSHSAVISWKTNEPSTSLVKYSTSPRNYPYFKEDTSYTTSHSITLTGLSPNTTYYFVVNSTDKAGNSAQSTEHSFKTKEFSNIVYVARDGSGDYNCDGEDDQIEINQAIAYINSIGGGIVHLKNGTF